MNIKKQLVFGIVAIATAVAPPALADDAPPSANDPPSTNAPPLPSAAPLTNDTPAAGSRESKDDASDSFLFGAKVGAVVPLGGTSANLRAGIDVGLVLPFAGRALAVVVSADYTAPKSEGTVTGDTRVNSASYDWHLTEHVFAVMPTLQYRLLSLGKLVPYAGVGPRVYFLTSNVTGSVGGTAIPETSERSTTVGIGVPVGLEYTLGPGRLQAELLFDYGGLSHAATGSSNAGALSLFAGYRIHM